LTPGKRILLTCNEPEFAALPLVQIVPILADRSRYIGSERSFYRVLHAHGQAHQRGRARHPQKPRAMLLLKSAGPNQVWSWDITYLPTTVRGVLLYLYLVIDVLSRKSGGLGCRRARGSSHRTGSGEQGLPTRADQQRPPSAADPPCRNGNAMRAAMLESRLEKLGVLRSFSRPRVSNDNPYSESLFRTA
jgi:putative transposase